VKPAEGRSSVLRAPRLLGEALAFGLLLASTAAHAQGAMYAYLPFKMQSSVSQPFGWYLDSRYSNPSGLTLASVQTAAESAWASWNGVQCALPKTQFLGLTGTIVPDPPDAFDVYNVMGVWAMNGTERHYQSYLYGIPDIMAMAVPTSYAGELKTCDVYLNAVNFMWDTTTPTATNSMDVESVLVHEFGHCLGLDHHYFNQLDVMQPNIPRGATRRTLTPADTTSLCNRYPLAGAVGAPCFGDGGCSAAGSKCITQTVNAQPKTFCTVGCQSGSGFICDIPLTCKPATFFNPTNDSACLMNDGSETKVGMACTNDLMCGSAVGYCQQPFQGISGTTFWQSGYCMQNCGAGRGPCPAGSLCTTLSAGNDFCLNQCRVGYGDCRPGYSCAETGIGGVCVPQCLNDIDCGDTSVWQCRTCDGLCVQKQNSAGQVGDICTQNSECGAGQVCAKIFQNNPMKICTVQCARGCGTCPTGSSCHPIGFDQELFCLRNCTSGTCPGAEQCAQLPTGRGCLPGCLINSDCPVGTECNFGECVLLGGDDSGCPFCPTEQDSGTNPPRRDAGTGGGGTGTCGCSTLSGPQTFFALALMLSFGLRRRLKWPNR
jgi:Matrixin